MNIDDTSNKRNNMIKDFLLAEVKQALVTACKENKVGQMTSAENDFS